MAKFYPFSLSTSKKTAKMTDTAKRLSELTLEEQFKVLRQERVGEDLADALFKKAKRYLQKDLIERDILAQRAVRELSKKALKLTQHIIQSPLLYPHISNDLERKEIVKDLLFSQDPFNYAFLVHIPEFFEKLEKETAFSHEAISEYFAMSDDHPRKEAQRLRVLSLVDETLDKIEKEKQEVMSDLTENSIEPPNYFATFNRMFLQTLGAVSRIMPASGKVTPTDEEEDGEGEGRSVYGEGN